MKVGEFSLDLVKMRICRICTIRGICEIDDDDNQLMRVWMRKMKNNLPARTILDFEIEVVIETEIAF